MTHLPPINQAGTPNLDRGYRRVPKSHGKGLPHPGGAGLFLVPPNRQDNLPALTCQEKFGGGYYY